MIRVKKFNQQRKPIRKCSIQEMCTSKMIDMPCDRWCSDEECIDTICRLIKIGIFDLDDMKQLLFYNDYCKVRKVYNNMQ